MRVREKTDENERETGENGREMIMRERQMRMRQRDENGREMIMTVGTPLCTQCYLFAGNSGKFAILV
jgi:hypothetical protein